MYEAAKELCVSTGTVTVDEVAGRLRSTDVDRVRAALDALVARELLAPGGGGSTGTYRPATGHEDVDV